MYIETHPSKSVCIFTTPGIYVYIQRSTETRVCIHVYMCVSVCIAQGEEEN